MFRINHPNILKVHDFLESKTKYYSIMDYCNQGNLNSYLEETLKLKYNQGVGERRAIAMFIDLINGFFELRKREIMHRDIKCENILVHDDRLIISDFGLSKVG